MRKRNSRPLCLEQLETREVLSTFYVAPIGNDANAGSTAAPWLTLQRAANAVQAGDTVVVRAGTYVGFSQADSTRSGTASAPIRYLADQGVVINSAGPDG